jgi:hypothetical protein
MPNGIAVPPIHLSHRRSAIGIRRFDKQLQIQMALRGMVINTEPTDAHVTIRHDMQAESTQKLSTFK